MLTPCFSFKSLSCSGLTGIFLSVVMCENFVECDIYWRKNSDIHSEKWYKKRLRAMEEQKIARGPRRLEQVKHLGR